MPTVTKARKMGINGESMKGKDWTLLALDAAGPRGLTPVQLQKALFLVGEEMKDAVRSLGDYYRFRAYDYGPFSSEVYRDADQLAERGLVEVQAERGERLRRYVITEAGSTAAARVRGGKPDDALTYLSQAVAWVSRLSFQDLVRAIYKKYPQYRVNSVFNG